jgi:hypothetical protein
MTAHTNVQTLEPLRRPEDGPRRRVYENVADMIADPENPTPMVRLSPRSRPADGFDIYVKLERGNPFGSIKDRTALYLLRGTPLREDQVLCEPTAGNTGIALAALANAQGTRIELALPEGTPESKKALLRFLGAELLEVEDELCPLFPTEGARGVVNSLVRALPAATSAPTNRTAQRRGTIARPGRRSGTRPRADRSFIRPFDLRDHHGRRQVPQAAQSRRQDHRRRTGQSATPAFRHQENFRPAAGTPAENPGLLADRRDHRGQRRRGLRSRHSTGAHRGHHGRSDHRRLPARRAGVRR